jgi:hypothetical protein
MAHSNGAVALLRLRGQQQFMSSTGARLFGIIITQMVSLSESSFLFNALFASLLKLLNSS